MVNETVMDRLRGVAAGSALGDAFGMPLEFKPRRSGQNLVRNFTPGRLAAGSFTDDTEMALALAESLLHSRPLDGGDLAARFLAWFRQDPPDVGTHTRAVLNRLAKGVPWQDVIASTRVELPDGAGNGSVMRCWPVAVAYWDDLEALLRDSALQSEITHPHADCVTASQLVNHMIYSLVHGAQPLEAFQTAVAAVDLNRDLRALLENAPKRQREELQNSGWVRHTLESAVWGLLTTHQFADAVMAVANLGNDADTAAAVVGALAGAAYGYAGIPADWRSQLRGEWPLESGRFLHAADFCALADQLAGAA